MFGRKPSACTTEDNESCSCARSGPAYAAPATAGTTVIIVTPAPAYTVPPVASGYGAGVVSQPIYDYAPGYGYGYTPGYWNRGYWGRYYGW